LVCTYVKAKTRRFLKKKHQVLLLIIAAGASTQKTKSRSGSSEKDPSFNKGKRKKEVQTCEIRIVKGWTSKGTPKAK
jgi:hypothetical protein